MSERKAGWYWVKFSASSPWEAMEWSEEYFEWDGVEPQTIGPRIPTPDELAHPNNCRNRLQLEGKSYPRSGCAVCGNGGLAGCPYERRGT